MPIARLIQYLIMRIKPLHAVVLTIVFLAGYVQIAAQDTRVQYPRFLSRSYIGVNMGYINYPFSSLQLEPGFQAESIRIPHLALQVLLLGHHINKNLSVQITYLRPVKWVEYKYVNGDQYIHSVWMNIGGLTAKYRIPVLKKFLPMAKVV